MENKKSTHKCEVVPIVIERHLGSDNLSIAHIYGFTCVVQTKQWEGKDRGVYIPPDSLVKVNRPEFDFLAPQARADGTYRIRAKKLRGVLSFGLLVPAPEGVEIGEDVADKLEVTHYEPPVRGAVNNRLFFGGEVAKPPKVYSPKYDLDSGRRYAKQVFIDGEPTICSEKIHGSFARFVFEDGKIHCGSKNEWKKEHPDYSHITVEKLLPNLENHLSKEEAIKRAEEIIEKLKVQSEKKIKNLWWKALDYCPPLVKFCESNPGVIICGELYGVQELRYGLPNGDIAFMAFDIMVDGRWLDYHEARQMADKFNVPWVPILAEMPYDFDKICQLAEGKTTVKGASHVREGTVVRPIKERYDHKIGRVSLKWVGAGYLEKAPEESVDEAE